MAIDKMSVRFLLPLLLALTAGCAPAYHCYRGCRIDCNYCAPPPLPYAAYDECVCHSDAVARHLQGPEAVEAAYGYDSP